MIQRCRFYRYCIPSLDLRRHGAAVVRHRHRLRAVANRLRGAGEPCDGVEEGVKRKKLTENMHNFEKSCIFALQNL